MTYQEFKKEIFDILIEDEGMTENQANKSISNCEKTIKGCYDREMSAGDTVNLLSTGF